MKSKITIFLVLLSIASVWACHSPTNNYRFTQKEFDKFNDLYYYGTRFYFPDVGIFITPEPTVGADNLNLQDALTLKYYDYCRNNPLRFIDPDGESYICLNWMEDWNQSIQKKVDMRVGFAPKWVRWVVNSMLQQSPEDITCLAIPLRTKALGIGQLGKRGGIIMKMGRFVETKAGIKLKWVKQEVIAEVKDLKPWVESLEQSAGVYETLKHSKEAAGILDAAEVYLKQDKPKGWIRKTIEWLRHGLGLKAQ